ncbi:MAG: phage terminase small subunit-related protein, partial [Clostridium sp.]
MARDRNLLRDKAFSIYKENHGNIKTNLIAKQLDIESSKVSSWKSQDKWDIQLGFKSRKRGAQKGNTNALGNNGGAPPGNYNAFKNGSCISEDKLISNIGKLLPKSMANTLMSLLGENPIDKLWRSILIQESKILTMQKIIRVKNIKDTTKEVKKQKTYKDKNMETE